MKSRDAQTLQLLFLDVCLCCQEMVNYTNCYIERLWPLFELQMELCDPVNEVGSHFFGYFLLVFQEICGEQEFLLLLQDEICNVSCMLGDALNVPHVEEIAHLQVACHTLVSLAPPFFGKRCHVAKLLGEVGCSRGGTLRGA